jgi:hypothetical protein
MTKIAKDTLMLAQERQTKYANQHRRELNFNIGDKVMLFAHNIHNPIDKYRPTRKLAPKYLGPYTISAIISPTSYKLDLPSTLKIHPVFHISMLKPYQETDEFNRDVAPQPVYIPETKEFEYEVEQILDKRIIRNKPQYLIKWLGYPLHDATWEPSENLKNAPEKLKEFELMRTSNFKKGRM